MIASATTRPCLARWAVVLAVVPLLIAGCAREGDAVAHDVDELTIQEVDAGSGAEAAAGMDVDMHYTGWLYDPAQDGGKGRQFDSSRDRGEAFTFPLGQGRVISGWDQGVAGMRVGGRRTLTIPSSLGYGAMGAGNGLIPGNAALVFDVELLAVR